jgi:hypothetical protein
MRADTAVCPREEDDEHESGQEVLGNKTIHAPDVGAGFGCTRR